MSDAYTDTLTQATDAAKRPSGLAYLSPSQKNFYRLLLYNDPWLFNHVVCGLTRLVPRIHQPITYAIAGRAEHLAWFLNTTTEKSLVIDQFRSELDRLGADPSAFDVATWRWDNAAAQRSMRKAISYFIQLLARGFYKSSNMMGTATWRITNDPNRTMLITHGVDDKAWALCEQMGDFLRSSTYRFFFDDPEAPEYRRFPDEPKQNILKNYIRLRGRTVPHKEPNVEARGATSTSTSGHYDIFVGDDITTVEQTPVEMQTAMVFLSRMPALQIHGNEIDRLFSETRHALDDAYAIVIRNPRVMHIELPNELHDEPLTLGTIRRVGIPTVPEIQNAEQIAEIKDDYLKDPEKGGLAYLQDYALVADAESASLFPPAVVDKREWQWAEDERKKKWIVRQARGNRDKSGKRTRLWVSGERIVELPENAPCPEGFTPKMAKIDPAQMHRVLGVDPAVSLVGDDWGVTAAAIDGQQFKYQLETIAAKGAEILMQAVLLLNEKWNPVKIGVEKAGAQELVIMLMQGDERFRSIKYKIVPVPNANVVKVTGIRNFVSGPLISGDLLLAPEDGGMRHEMKVYKPMSPKAIDNRLDSLVVASKLLDASRAESTDAIVARAAEARADRVRESFLDPATFIDTSTNWMEAMF